MGKRKSEGNGETAEFLTDEHADAAVAISEASEASEQVRKKPDNSNRPTYAVVGVSKVTGAFSVLWTEKTISRARRAYAKVSFAFSPNYYDIHLVRIKRIVL